MPEQHQQSSGAWCFGVPAATTCIGPSPYPPSPRCRTFSRAAKSSRASTSAHFSHWHLRCEHQQTNQRGVPSGTPAGILARGLWACARPCQHWHLWLCTAACAYSDRRPLADTGSVGLAWLARVPCVTLSMLAHYRTSRSRHSHFGQYAQFLEPNRRFGLSAGSAQEATSRKDSSSAVRWGILLPAPQSNVPASEPGGG